MIQGYVCNFRRRVVRVSDQTACRTNSQSDKHYPGSPVALEGVPLTDELLADFVCLSPTLEVSLRDVVVAHIVRSMEDEGLNI